MQCLLLLENSILQMKYGNNILTGLPNLRNIILDGQLIIIT